MLPIEGFGKQRNNSRAPATEQDRSEGRTPRIFPFGAITGHGFAGAVNRAFRCAAWLFEKTGSWTKVLAAMIGCDLLAAFMALPWQKPLAARTVEEAEGGLESPWSAHECIERAPLAPNLGETHPRIAMELRAHSHCSLPRPASAGRGFPRPMESKAARARRQ